MEKDIRWIQRLDNFQNLKFDFGVQPVYFFLELIVIQNALRILISHE